MHQQAVARKTELEAEEAKIKQLESQARDEIIDLEHQIETAKTELDRLEQQHIAACKLEAAGKKSDRVSCEANIASTSARLKGSQHLLDEKRQELRLLRDGRGPKDQELSQLYAQEAVEQHLSEIEAEKAAGMAEAEQFHKLEVSFIRRVAALRQCNYNETTPRAGKVAADALERTWARVRL